MRVMFKECLKRGWPVIFIYIFRDKQDAAFLEEFKEVSLFTGQCPRKMVYSGECPYDFRFQILHSGSAFGDVQFISARTHSSKSSIRHPLPVNS